jgi:hypothetical protein
MCYGDIMANLSNWVPFARSRANLAARGLIRVMESWQRLGKTPLSRAYYGRCRKRRGALRSKYSAEVKI